MVNVMLNTRDKIEIAVSRALKMAEGSGISDYDVVVALVARELGIKRDRPRGTHRRDMLGKCGTNDGNAFRIRVREGFVSLTTWNHNENAEEDNDDCTYYEEGELETCMDHHRTAVVHIGDGNPDVLEELYEMIRHAAGK